MTKAEFAFAHPEFERLERDDILALQHGKLAALGARLSESPEWVAHFARAGMAPGDLADPQALAAAPMLEKADLRAQYPFPMLTVEMGEVARFFATSGTTGPPVMFGFSRRDIDELLPRQVARLLTAIGVRRGDRAYQGYGYGLWIGGPAFDLGLHAVGATVFPIGPGRGELVVEWLRDQEYEVASLSPLWMMTLATIAKERGIDPKRDWKLRVGAFGGQSISAAFRDQIEAELPDGFMAHNTYGSTEAGGPVVSASCPASHDRDQMHLINEDSLLTEIVDPETLAPTRPGEVGEIVVTTLDKEASPIVRWRSHDLVRLAEKPFDCPCGRAGLPLIGRIVGRSDDMLKVRGVIVFPSQIEDVIAANPHTIKEAWQIYVDRVDQAHEHIAVAVERQRSANLAPADLVRALEDSFRSRLGIRVAVECHGEGALPRYEAKATRVLERSRT